MSARAPRGTPARAPRRSAGRRRPAPAAGSQPHSAQCQSRLRRPAPGAPQLPLVRRLQRARAASAPGGRTAAGAGQPRRVPPPRHLHEDGAALQPLPHGLPGQARQPGRPRRLVARQLPVPDGAYERGRGPRHRAVGDQRRGPAALHQLGGLDRAARTAQQEGALVVRGPQFQDLPHVRERARCRRCGWRPRPPTPRRGRGPRRVRTSPRGCRPRPAPRRAAPRATAGSAARGPNRR